MKRNLLLTAFLTLFVFALSASAQKTTDFSGSWTLDASKSSPAETMIDSQTIKVTQTATDVKVEATTKMKAMPDGGSGAPGGGGGRGTGGGGGARDYGIGTPIKTTRQFQGADVEISMGAKIDGNKLTLTTTSPQGSRDEVWTMNSDGTVTVQSQGRGGAAVSRTYKKG
jgi:hypothetical protein